MQKYLVRLDEVELLFRLGKLDIHDNIKIKMETWNDEKGNPLIESIVKMIDTTVGRVIFNRILPEKIRFVNQNLEKGAIKNLITRVYDLYGEDVTTEVADKIKEIGFEYAMYSGITLAVADITIPPEKEEILSKSQKDVDDIQKAYRRGLLTELERNNRTIEIWQETTKVVGDAVHKYMDPEGNVASMANSGATKGGFGPISQLAGMRGLMADPAGRIIRLPIQSNFREGLTALEYFISTHGARKGLADTALRTADAGYLTRRLVDVAQDLIINEDDCGTNEGILIRKTDNIAGQSMATRILGRLLAEKVVDEKTGEILAERDDMLGP